MRWLERPSFRGALGKASTYLCRQLHGEGPGEGWRGRSEDRELVLQVAEQLCLVSYRAGESQTAGIATAA